MVLFVNPPRELGRDDHGAVELAVAYVLYGLFLVAIVNRDEGANVRAHGIKSFANLQRLRASVLIDDGEARVANLPAERIAQDDELYQRKNHGREHERRRTEKLAHLALDNGHHSVHFFNPGRFMAAAPAAAASRRHMPSAVRRATAGPCSARIHRPASCSAPRATSLQLQLQRPFLPVQLLFASRYPSALGTCLLLRAARK